MGILTALEALLPFLNSGGYPRTDFSYISVTSTICTLASPGKQGIL
jgi:hypothetical protein